MWAAPGLIFLVVVLSTKESSAQDSRLDHVFRDTENAGLEVMQENPCPKGCLPEKRARSIGAGGPLLDVLSRRSALDKNFMRFGRAPPETSSPTRDENVYRASRAKNTNFIRLGRGKADNFMRFGRRDDFMRFGRRDDFMRFGRRDDFMRFGRAGGKVRVGTTPDEDVSEDDVNEDGQLEADDDDRRWKRNARH